MPQVLARDVKAELIDRLRRPPYRAAVPGPRSPDALPFLAAVGELARRGWALDVEDGADGREYVVAARRGRA